MRVPAFLRAQPAADGRLAGERAHQAAQSRVAFRELRARARAIARRCLARDALRLRPPGRAPTDAGLAPAACRARPSRARASLDGDEQLLPDGAAGDRRTARLPRLCAL